MLQTSVGFGDGEMFDGAEWPSEGRDVSGSFSTHHTPCLCFIRPDCKSMNKTCVFTWLSYSNKNICASFLLNWKRCSLYFKIWDVRIPNTCRTLHCHEGDVNTAEVCHSKQNNKFKLLEKKTRHSWIAYFERPLAYALNIFANRPSMKENM